MEQKTWTEFRNSGLFWFINRSLHLFGWAIVMEMNGDEVEKVYPARVNFRGFSRSDEEEGFEKLTQHIAEIAPSLVADVKQ